MARKEEIMQEANTRYSVNHPFIDIAKESFIAGANWADKTMLDHACEWLYINAEDYTLDKGLAIESFIYSFKKAMEGGAE